MIVVDDLWFKYPTAAEDTLRGMRFDVRRGEIFGLLGPSGVGKSTMQRILIGLQRGWRGRAEVFGAPIGALGRAYYERVGVSFETPNLYGRLTALENLEMFAALYGGATREPRALLAALGLEEAAQRRAEALSKGMRMRLNLARALLHQPELLFLDEPTGGQDPNRVRLIRTLIRELAASGTTVFLTTHNMTDAAEICDRVGFLVDGAMPVIGAPEALMRRYGRRRVAVAVDDPGQAGGEARAEFDLDGLGENAAFLAMLRRGRIRSIRSQEASLEDVFIAVAGGGEPEPLAESRAP